MKTLKTKYLLCAVVVMAMTTWLPVTTNAADESMKPMKGGEHQEMMMDGKMMQGCQAMMDQKQKMAENMKAHDAELNRELAEMNSAADDKKMGLMAAVITHMGQERIAMNAQMATMHDKMMQHMMQHMQMGKECMTQCPMMRGMGGMKGMSGMKSMGNNSADSQMKPRKNRNNCIAPQPSAGQCRQ